MLLRVPQGDHSLSSVPSTFKHAAGASARRPNTTAKPTRPISRLVAKAVNVEELIEEVDLVAYKSPKAASPPQALRLARVIKVLPSGQVEVEPLVEEEQDVFVADDLASTEPVDAQQLVAIVAYELSQRQDRVSNPHGEHAHDIFRILQPLTNLL